MTLAEVIYHHALNLPEPAAREVLRFVEEVEKRYVSDIVTPPSDLTPEQLAAYKRLSSIRIDWEGKPITDRDEANAR
jgi:hypothetical protein